MIVLPEMCIRDSARIVRITPISREIIESNPNLKVIVRHGAGFDALDVKACHDNNVQALYAPVANSKMCIKDSRSLWRLLVRSLLSLGLITVSEQTSPMLSLIHL